MKHYRYFICVCSLLIMATTIGHTAGSVNPRIPALESDSTYIALLERQAALTIEEDSLSQLLVKYRNEYATGSTSAGSAIMSVESRLFDLRGIRTSTVNGITEIEQRWIVNNPTYSLDVVTTESRSTAIDSDDTTKSIANSQITLASLPDQDRQNLMEAEQMEIVCAELFEEYMDHYQRLQQIDALYSSCEDEDSAVELYREYRTLTNVSDSLSVELSNMWSQIYDNKNFAYGILLEVKGYNDLLDRSIELSREAESQISNAECGAKSRAALSYDLQKRSLLTLEELIANKLQLSLAIDSLKNATKSIASREAILTLPEIIITKRSFILYEPIMFSENETYSTSSPIPETVVYGKGTIYRIQYGAYKNKQLPSIFRQAYPLSYDRALGFWTYYGGGYETYAEAVEAVALSKRRGFNRPEVVIWRDGERRNLNRDPLPQSKGYRAEISGISELTDSVKAAIELHCKGAELSKIGADKYIINPIENILYTEDFVKCISDIDDNISIEVTEIK